MPEQNMITDAPAAEFAGGSKTDLYDEVYFRSHCGPIPYTRDQQHWLNFFGGIANQIVISLAPRRVLDAGCAMGFLMEALWDRGVEAWGIDISEYAISQVRRDMAPYCRVASLTEPIADKFDLIVCIEVLEHMPEHEARLAIANLAAASDTLLFSSSPTDFAEVTHVNVRPTISWIRQFAEFGLHPDVLFDARFVAPHAMLFRRGTPPPDDTLILFARLIQHRIDVHERDVRIHERDVSIDRLQRQSAAEINALTERRQALESELQGVRAQIAGVQTDLASAAHAQIARVDALNERLEQQRETAAAHATRLEQINEHVEQQREATSLHDADLRQVRALQTQFGLAITSLKTELLRSDRRISQIYDSRIWKSLVAGGGIIERMFGLRRKQVRYASPEVSRPEGSSLTVPLSNNGRTGGLRYSLDEPRDGQEFPFGQVIVRGWAIAEAGEIEISARLGRSGQWILVPHGNVRLDVSRFHNDVPHAARSGFILRMDSSSLSPGDYPIDVKMRGPAGESIDINRTIRIVPPEDAPSLSQEGSRVAPDDRVHLKIEIPNPSAPLFLGSILQVQGWAVAQKGIERVLAWLDDDGPHEVTYGLMREDIRSQYEEFTHSAHPGFVWYWSTATLPAGTYRVQVQAISKAGTQASAVATFQIDSRTKYSLWADLNAPTPEQLKRLGEECGKFDYLPKISIVTPVYRTPEGFLKKCIASVRRQVYPNWELLLVDDASNDAGLTALFETFAKEEPRISVTVLPENAGIAGATNRGIEMATGDFVAFLDHDDEITPDALFHIVKALNDNRSFDVLYSDEDKIDLNGDLADGFFKPDWSPDLLGSMNYVCHFLVCRRPLLEKVGGLRMGFDGSQDYDLILRLSQQTNQFHRIPNVLYHWRMHAKSTAMHTGQKPKASDAGRRALEDHLRCTGIAGKVEEVGPCRYRMRYRIQGAPEVSIVIPAGGSDKLKVALRSVFNDTNYRNYRLVVVDNSPGGDVERWVREFKGGDRKIERLDCRKMPFNFSRLCNRGAEHTTSPYVLFLNDDTAVIAPDWLEAMLEHAQRPQVGAVGAQLLFPNDTIQHAGVVLGIIGVAGHVFRGFDAHVPHYFALSHAIRNCLAVTGACLLTRREVFEEVGRFDEVNLPTCFQDVDFCLKAYAAGYRIVYTPYAQLYHFESATKRAIAQPDEIRYMEDRWKRFIEDDPFYNPNLSRRSDAYELDLAEWSVSGK